GGCRRPRCSRARWASRGGCGQAPAARRRPCWATAHPTARCSSPARSGPEALEDAMRHEALAVLAARSPLGVPAIPGVLLRCAEPGRAEAALRAYGLLRPLT